MRNQLTDDELVLQFVKGDRESFEELVYRYKNTLYQYIMVMVRDEGAAGDLFQEVFLQVYKNAEKYRPQGKFKAWLFRMAHNRVLNFFRDRDSLYSLDAPQEEDGCALQDTLPDGSPLPLQELESRELGEQIRRASLCLPDKQRETLYLRQYLSFQEIADLTGRPLGTVLADGHRAVKKMQTLLQKEALL